MMKLKHVFLLTSLCIALNLVCSDEPEATSYQQNPGESRKTSFSEKNNDDASATVIRPQKSTLLTKAWYGLTTGFHLTNRAKVFLDMYTNGTLEGDLISQPKLAEDRLRDAVHERFMERDLKGGENQQYILDIFAIRSELAQKTGRRFVLDQQRADEYNPLLGTALEAITRHHATVVQPSLDHKRLAEIATANRAYEHEMTHEHLALAEITAANKRELHAQSSQSSATFDLQEEKHYQNLKSYEALLQTLRSPDTA